MTKDSVNHSPHHQTSEHNVTQPTENYTSEDDKEDHTPTITGDEQADNSQTLTIMRLASIATYTAIASVLPICIYIYIYFLPMLVYQ